MRIYFAGSIRAGRDDEEVYQKMINYLKKHGEVLTEHVGAQDVITKEEKGFTEKQIFERDMKWLRSADVLIAEVTTPSLGVGYEIAKAAELNKRVLCLYRPKAGKMLSAIISGDKKIIVKQYKTLKQAFGIIDGFFKI
ncbi:hypothetical protein A3K72_00745 [Candidatus Woesearchaeota archaeon RBG_13_36_6]|nr:MAG: hypothetical protein A3K72_00745 [Candidatus Woesearchaeota archaeon RBG_13_36_6]